MNPSIPSSSASLVCCSGRSLTGIDVPTFSTRRMSDGSRPRAAAEGSQRQETPKDFGCERLSRIAVSTRRGNCADTGGPHLDSVGWQERAHLRHRTSGASGALRANRPTLSAVGATFLNRFHPNVSRCTFTGAVTSAELHVGARIRAPRQGGGDRGSSPWMRCRTRWA
jgi:hypothetical protein